MAKLTLEQANKIIEVAFAKGKELGLKPLAVAVLDAGGQLQAYQRQQGGILRFEIAFGKAWGSLGMGRSSRQLEKLAMERPHFIQAAIAASDGRLVPVAGGVLVKSKDGEVVGAIGVSGDTSDNDEKVGVAGIEAAGLVAEV